MKEQKIIQETTLKKISKKEYFEQDNEIRVSKGLPLNPKTPKRKLFGGWDPPSKQNSTQ